jgi:UDP-GlcNAc:undecaprenyl-phosphate/decaprenyl-phosphate GlcNAc-1-phosphate transferase
MISIIQVLFSFIIGFFLVYLTIPIVVRVSKAKKLFDFPDERKVNTKVIPNLGGISIFIGISIATLLTLGNIHFPEFRYILAGMIILLFIGIKDDILVISARKKFIAQIACALILIIAGNIRFTNLHGVLGLHEINYAVSLGFSMLAIVGIVNALNLIDGIDGLASGLGVMASVLFGVLFLSMGNINYSIVCFAVSGSLTMFSIYNVFGKVNKIFMGDTGSLILGLLVAVFVIKYNEIAISGNEEVYNFSPALSMAIIAIPFFDMIRVFFIRIMKKKSPVFPDMNHIHHKLLRLNYSHLKSSLVLIVSNLFLIGMIFLLRELNIHILLIVLFSVTILMSYIPDFIYMFKVKKEKKTYSLKEKNAFTFIKLMDLTKQDFQQSRFIINEFNSISPKKKREKVYME